MIISLIAAIGKNNAIGVGGKLPWNLPADMKYFRETTKGHPVIMGRKTFESISHPLPNRQNIVITRDKNYKAEGIEIVHSLEEALALFPRGTLGKDTEIFVIGGSEIYKQAIEKADKLYITHIDKIFPETDTYFPIIDDTTWKKEKSEKYSKNDLNKYNMEFVEYIRKV